MQTKFKARSPKKFYTQLSGVAVCALGAFLYFFAEKLSVYPLWLISASLVAFTLYGYDKLQSKRGGERIPEVVLHALTLAGGFPGAWLGRFVFRHKTRKPVFLIILFAATLLHGSLFFFLGF